MNTKNKSLILCAALAVLAGSTSIATAQKSTVKLHGRDSEGFNALDHVLQKPLANPEFPEGQKGFFNNMFVGVNAGASLFGYKSVGGIRPGFSLGGHIGGWFTPVHGFELTGGVGRHSVFEGVKNAYYGSVKADYMLNMSALMRGYNPDRVFECIGTIGPVYHLIRQSGVNSNSIGGATSIQMRLNANRMFYLFAQPELTMIAGTRYNTTVSHVRMYTDFGMNVGLGYRMLTGERREQGHIEMSQEGVDNLYFGAGGGLFNYYPNTLEAMSPVISGHIGKALTALSSFQFTANLGHRCKGPGVTNRFAGIGSLDYVFSVSNAMLGYRDDNAIQMTLNVGGSLAKIQGADFYTGLQAGLTGLVRLSDNWALFVSPQVYRFTDEFNKALKAPNRPMFAVQAGVRYSVGDFWGKFPESQEAFEEDDKHWFAKVAYGSGTHGRTIDWLTKDYSASFGQRFTPLSSWRANLEGTFFEYYSRGMVGADYMVDMATSMFGYNSERLLGLQAAIGPMIGISHFEGNTTLATGLKAGLQGSLRLNKEIELVVEPEVLVLRDAVCGEQGARKWTPEARVSVGLQYHFDLPEK